MLQKGNIFTILLSPMRSHEQEDYFPDDQNASQTEESTVDNKKRNTLRVVLGALAVGAGAFGTYKGEEFISNLIVEKDQAVRDAKQAQMALERQTQEKDALLQAYREQAYNDVMGRLSDAFYNDLPLSQAVNAIDQSPELTDTLKKEMHTSGFESRIDAFVRMHQFVQPFVASHFKQETDLFHRTLSNILAYSTSKGALTANVQEIYYDQLTFAEVDYAFAELSDNSASVLVPGFKDIPPGIVQTPDLFKQRLNDTSDLIYRQRSERGVMHQVQS